MFAARSHFLHSKAPAFEDALEAAILAVRSDVAPNDWVLCGFKGGDSVQLIGTGTGGIEVSIVMRERMRCTKCLYLYFDELLSVACWMGVSVHADCRLLYVQ